MKRTALIIATILTAGTLAFAQTDLSYKYWNDGQLTQNDFQRRTSDGEIIGQVFTGIETQSGDWEKVKWNFRVKRLQSKTTFDPLRSWITKDDSLSDKARRYAQLQFDASEVTRRQMMNYLYEGTYKPDYYHVIQRFYDLHQAQISEIERITDNGKNAVALTQQEKIVADQLSGLTDAPTGIPEYTLRKFSIGMYIGASSQFHPGDYSQYFSPAYGFLWGFDIGLGKSEIYWDIILGGGSRLKQNIPGDEISTWNGGNRLRYGESTFQYAYNIYDGGTFKISPFAGFGVGFMDYDSPDSNAEIKTDEIAGLRLAAGLCIDLKYLNSLYLVSDMVWSSIYGGLNENSIKLKVYVARTTYENGMNPYSLNCSLSISLMSKYMKP